MRYSRVDVLRRLRRLQRLEFFNVALVPGALLLWWANSADGWIARLPALAVVVLFLIHGASYWKEKASALAAGSRSISVRAAQKFEFSKLLDRGLLALLFVYLGMLMLLQKSDAGDLAWGGALFVFAVLEYVNYFHWQLTHDQVSDVRYLLRWRRLRESSLATDLRRFRRQSVV